MAVVFGEAFVGEDGLLGQEAVLERVLGGTLLALVGARAGGMFCVLLVGVKFFLRDVFLCHDWEFLWSEFVGRFGASMTSSPCGADAQVDTRASVVWLSDG